MLFIYDLFNYYIISKSTHPYLKTGRLDCLCKLVFVFYRICALYVPMYKLLSQIKTKISSNIKWILEFK